MTSKAATAAASAAPTATGRITASTGFFPPTEPFAKIADGMFKRVVDEAKASLAADIKLVTERLAAANLTPEQTKLFLHPSHNTMETDHAMGLGVGNTEMNTHTGVVYDEEFWQDRVFLTLGGAVTHDLDKKTEFVTCKHFVNGARLPLGGEQDIISASDRIARHLPQELLATMASPCDVAISKSAAAAAPGGGVCALCWYTSLAGWFRFHDSMLERQKKSQGLVKHLPSCPGDGKAGPPLGENAAVWVGVMGGFQAFRSTQPMHAKPGAKHKYDVVKQDLPEGGVPVQDKVCPHCSSLDMRMIWNDEGNEINSESDNVHEEKEFKCGECAKYLSYKFSAYAGSYY